MTDLEKIISYFKQISKIPRTSGDEQAISDYLVAFAKERNLAVIQDESRFWIMGSSSMQKIRRLGQITELQSAMR